jgi:hypothetical protein
MHNEPHAPRGLEAMGQEEAPMYLRRCQRSLFGDLSTRNGKMHSTYVAAALGFAAGQKLGIWPQRAQKGNHRQRPTEAKVTVVGTEAARDYPLKRRKFANMLGSREVIRYSCARHLEIRT